MNGSKKWGLYEIVMENAGKKEEIEWGTFDSSSGQLTGYPPGCYRDWCGYGRCLNCLLPEGAGKECADP